MLVPVTHPKSAVTLLELAVSLADPGGLVVPVTVLSPGAGEEEREAAYQLILSAEKTAVDAGVDARGMIDIDPSVANGVLNTALECEATLVVIGWQGRSSHQNIFGSLIDSIAGRSAVPLAVARLGAQAYRRILLPVNDDHLDRTAAGGLRLAVGLATRLRDTTGAPVRVLRSGEGRQDLPAELTALSDRIHVDPRRLDLAVGAAARADDLVVVPVAPTVSGLRAATTHVAWAAPEASLLVALDVGPASVSEDLAPAVRSAGAPAPPTRRRTDHALYRILVSACLPGDGEGKAGLLDAALAPVGDVTARRLRHDERGRVCVLAEVGIAALDANAALGEVMEALHRAPGFDGAEISYTLVE